MSDEEFGGYRSCSEAYGGYNTYSPESYKQQQQEKEKQRKIDDGVNLFFQQRARFRAMEMLFKFCFFLVLAIVSFFLIMTCINGKTIDRVAEDVVVFTVVTNSRGHTLVDASGNAYPLSSLTLFGSKRDVTAGDLVNVFDQYAYTSSTSYDVVLDNAQPGWGTYSFTAFLILMTIFSFLWFLSGPAEDNFKD